MGGEIGVTIGKCGGQKHLIDVLNKNSWSTQLISKKWERRINNEKNKQLIKDKKKSELYVYIWKNDVPVIQKGILSVVSTEAAEDNDQLGKRPKLSRELIEFGDEDLEGTTQLHDEALVLTSKIRGFVVKRVLIYQGSEAEVMYPDL